MRTLVFVRSHGLFGRIIRWLTRPYRSASSLSSVTHVLIGGGEEAGQELLLHASAGGVQHDYRDAYLQSCEFVAER